MTDASRRVRRLADAAARDLGLVVLDVVLTGAHGRKVARVVVDRKGGVPLGECQELSARLSAALDQEDPIPGRYALEVTSPGVDRPLRDRDDFDRVEGRAVLVHREAPDGRVLQLRGTVVAVDEDAVVVGMDGRDVAVPYTEIVKATQTLPW